MKNLDLKFNAHIENYDSPFYDERKMEHESLEKVLLFKKCWVLCIENNCQNYMRSIEMDVQEILIDDYGACQVEFNRENKSMHFQIDGEQIDL